MTGGGVIFFGSNSLVQVEKKTPTQMLPTDTYLKNIGILVNLLLPWDTAPVKLTRV